MSTTQIPPPLSEDPEPNEEYRTLAALEDPSHEDPVVLLELKDELARSRVREAFWISVVFHLFIVFSLMNLTKWAPGWQKVVVASPTELMQQRDTTYLELPPDLQKPTRKPDTNIISDKDRIASSKNPTLDHKALRKILDSARPGPPGPPGPAQRPNPTTSAPAPVQQAQQQPSQGPPAPQQGTPPPPPSQNQTAMLQQPSSPPGGGAVRSNNPFSSAMSAGSAIQEAARATVNGRGIGGGAGGDYGLGAGRQGGTVHSQLDILSDTQGVDFGPYLERILHTVRMNWYNLIPEVARPPLMKRGKVSIEFAITKNGQIAGMRLAGQSGDVSLDRAAWGGITASNPFPPLPSEFSGQYLALRFHFFYNPDRHDLQ
jgi:TonB family protein